MVKFREIVDPNADPPQIPREMEVSNEHAERMEALEKRMGVRNWERVESITDANVEPQQSKSQKGK